jgi:hypothetical protein
MKHNSKRHLLLELLSESVDPLTATELSILAGVESSTGRRFIRDARENGIVYIAEWKRAFVTGHGYAARYAVGSKKDAPEPQPEAPYEACIRYRKRNAALLRVRRMAKSGAVNPFAQLMWATR